MVMNFIPLHWRYPPGSVGNDETQLVQHHKELPTQHFLCHFNYWDGVPIPDDANKQPDCNHVVPADHVVRQNTIDIKLMHGYIGRDPLLGWSLRQIDVEPINLGVGQNAG